MISRFFNKLAFAFAATSVLTSVGVSAQNIVRLSSPSPRIYEQEDGFLNAAGQAIGNSPAANAPVLWAVTGVPTALKMPKGSTEAFPYGLNNNGYSFGSVNNYTQGGAVVWSADGTVSLLDVDAGYDAYPVAIGDTDEIVGSEQSESDQSTKAIRWTADTKIDVLPMDGYSGAEAEYTNSSGEVVGAVYGAAQTGAYWSSTDELTPLKTPDGYTSNAAFISASHMIFGSVSGNGVISAASWATPTSPPIYLSLAGYNETNVRAISSNGFAVGCGMSPNNPGGCTPVVWSQAGVATNLKFPAGATACIPSAVNSGGTSVGVCSIPNDQLGIIWDVNGNPTDVRQIMGSQWYAIGLDAINDNGNILGSGVEKGRNVNSVPFVLNGYFYNTVSQVRRGIGASGLFTVEKPYLAATDFHTLAELAVTTSDQLDTVEVGWLVDPVTNHGDLNPHLFVFYWVNGIPSPCYNCNFMVANNATYKPGDTLPVNHMVPMLFEIKYVNGNWNVYVSDDANPIGYFPGSLWKGRYKEMGKAEWFGEVAAGGSAPKTWMGNGVLGTVPGGALITSMSVFNNDGSITPAKIGAYNVTNGLLYNLSLTNNNISYGGPGAN